MLVMKSHKIERLRIIAVNSHLLLHERVLRRIGIVTESSDQFVVELRKESVFEFKLQVACRITLERLAAILSAAHVGQKSQYREGA